MVAPVIKRTTTTVATATAADLAALPDHVRAEIIHGAITQKVAPSGEHSGSQGAMVSSLFRRFQREPGGRWPGGWWFGTETEVEYATHEIFVHDVAGWKRERMPNRPSGRPLRTHPDWVCEVVSPSNEKRDRIDKFQVLHQSGVPHYWIVDPLEHTLQVHRWTDRGYTVILAAEAGDIVRAEPFEAVELRVSTLFGLEEDEE